MSVNYFIISAITNLLTAIGLTYSFSKISNRPIKFSTKNILIMLIFSILSNFNNYYNVVTMKIILAFVLTILMIKIIFRDTIKNTFIIVVILGLISLLIEVAFLPFIPTNISTIDILNNELMMKTIFSIINNFVLILFISNKKVLNFLKNIKNIIKNFISFYTLSILLICLINIIIYFFAYNVRNIQLTIGLFISILILLICLRTIINDKYNNSVLKEKNKILREEQKAYANTIDECRELKHNLKNDLYSLKAGLSKEYQNIINSLIVKYNNNYEWINTLNDIPEGLQGLLYLKINEAKKDKIKIILTMKNIVKTSNNDYMNLCSILGILIDNAIDASKNAKSKTILVDIRTEKEITIIKIVNVYINKIDITKIGKKNYSTKEYASGLGLNFINKIKKSNVKVNFKIVNNLFTTTVKYTKEK